MAKLIACGPLSEETEEALMLRYTGGMLKDFIRTNDYAVQLQESNRQLRATVAALERDAKRYRWLRDVADRNDDGSPYCAIQFEVLLGDEEDDDYELQARWTQGEELDKAVDAAMQLATASKGIASP